MGETNAQPIRPQRGMARANTRETTGGLLMSVIRSLSSSRELVDRDRERADLEKGFQQCDQKLNDLVAQHNHDLYHVMNIFSKILSNLGRSKEKLLDTREKLQNCQKLLHCKRDELKKLWLESVENRTVLDLLERIETVAGLPRMVDSYTTKKYYLHAAQCCVDGLRQLGEEPAGKSTISASRGGHKKTNSRYGDTGYGDLSKIEALSEVRIELVAKKEALFELSIDELHRHLYIVSSSEVRKRFHRNGSFRSAQENGDLSVGGGRSRKVSSAIEILTNSGEMRKMLQSSPSIDTSKVDPFFAGEAEPNAFDAYPEEDSRQFISMLTKCLGLLNKIPDAIEVIRERADREFINVVIKTAQDVLVSSGSTPSVSVPVTRVNSCLDISSMGSDSFNGVLSGGESAHHIGGATMTPSGSIVVLTCTSLLGHAYNGYSHLNASSGPHNSLPDGALQLTKSSLQLQDFFDMLMRQYRAIVSLHECIVLPNLQKIESGLHAFADTDADSTDGSSTTFYTATYLWGKVQSLVQQLVEYYLEAVNVPSVVPGGGATGAKMGVTSINALFIMASGGAASGGANSTSSSSAALPTDYSSYFSKRRALAGAMNAMNVMTKNTMTAVASAANAATSANLNDSTSHHSSAGPSGGGGGGSSTLASSGGQGASSNSAGSGGTGSHTGSSFLSSVVGSRSNTASVSLFKFDNSTQAISWNSFMAEQAQLNAQQLLSPKSEDKGAKGGSDEKDKDDDPTASSSSATSPSVMRRLFEALHTISEPTPDNLVVIYGTLMEFAQQSPPFTDPELDLDARSIKSFSSVVQQDSAGQSNALQAFLMLAADKFVSHINEQLDKMIEVASKSLEAGTTVSIAHMSPLTAALLEEAEESVGGGAQGTVSKAQQNQHHFAQQQLNSKLYPPLLEAAVLVDVATRDLRALMQAMPEYSSVFLGYICNYLSGFRDSCSAVYQNIVEPAGGQPSSGGFGLTSSASAMDISAASRGHGAGNQNSGDRRIISATWAKDEDISRLLKSLPNWTILQEHQKASLDLSFLAPSAGASSLAPSAASMANSGTPRKKPSLLYQMSSVDESPEEIRLRNLRETQILIQNLSQNAEVRRHELLWQDGQFQQLAQLQESFEWLAARCDDLVGSIDALQKASASETAPPADAPLGQLPEVYIATLNSLAKDFADLAETALMVLHLEVRIHVFYHLQGVDSAFFTTPIPSLEPELAASRSSSTAEHYSDDPKIYPLLDDVKKIHDELGRASLKSYKMAYIYEGLDHLISTIFVNSATEVKRVKQSGVKRACRAIYDIQRRLSMITKCRELALDNARQYFELFLSSPEEIMASILERGPAFPLADYETVFTLLHRSGLVAPSLGAGTDQHSLNADMESNLHRLRDILGNVSLQI